MIIDSSALVAVVFKEPDWQHIFEKMHTARSLGIGAPTLVEAGIVITARKGPTGKSAISRLIQEFGIILVPFGAAHWQVAVDAYQRFGKGRHRASLNFGDCLSYATAWLARQPLLCKGGDFPQTDLVIA